VQEIKNYVQEYADPHVLLVGTGKIGRTACENLVNQTEIRSITLTNRTDEKAQKLAHRYGIDFIDFNELEKGLDKADVIIVATGAPEATVLYSHFKTVKKRLILDLSVPRNAETSLYDHPDFQVIDVDHLSVVTSESLQKRRDEIPAAEAIIQQMTDDFYVWLESRKVAPTLQALREKMDTWKSREVNNLLKKFPDLNAEYADVLASQILDRITGQFARQLKNGTDINGNLRTIHHIFELEN
ncbi:MAG: NAD(P)-binding domain-containing protein, partial [Owenweeksia sp.]